MTESHSPPLQGIRVLELGHFVAGPGVSMTLRELGAEVLKIEPLAGDSARHMGPLGQAIVNAYNRGKRSIAVDLQKPEGRALVQRLAGTCDVVVQNQRPGVVERMGLGAAQLRERHPRLIYLSVSGFGSRGISRDRPGFDVVGQAESGLMSVTGDPAGPPQKVGAPIIDKMTAHVGTQAVLAALFRRERTGEGATIETSLLENALHLQQCFITDFMATGIQPRRPGHGSEHFAPGADLIRTADGHIAITAYIDAHWARLCGLIGRPELGEDPRFETNALRVANREAMRQALTAHFERLSTEDAVRLLAGGQIVAAAVRQYADVVASDDVRMSGMLLDVPTADGAGYRTLGLPYAFDGEDRPNPPAAPGIGSDTESVLAGIGVSREECEALRRAGVVA